MDEKMNERQGEPVTEGVVELDEAQLDAIAGGQGGTAKLFPMPNNPNRYMVLINVFDRSPQSLFSPRSWNFKQYLSFGDKSFEEALAYVESIAPGSKIDVQQQVWRGVDKTPGVGMRPIR